MVPKDRNVFSRSNSALDCLNVGGGAGGGDGAEAIMTNDGDVREQIRQRLSSTRRRRVALMRLWTAGSWDILQLAAASELLAWKLRWLRFFTLFLCFCAALLVAPGFSKKFLILTGSMKNRIGLEYSSVSFLQN